MSDQNQTRSNMAGYDVLDNPIAPNLLFHMGGTDPESVYVFTPTIIESTEGWTLSWTNNAGLVNPPTILIPKAEDGTDGQNGITFTPHTRQTASGYEIYFTNDGGAANPDPVEVTNGIDGTNGTDGTDGITYTPHITDIAGGYRLSWTNDGGQPNPQSVEILNGAHGIPQGGLAGQVLSKVSGTDYDVEWTDPEQGTIDYDDLEDKPAINGVTLEGNKTSTQLDLKELIEITQAEYDALVQAGEVDSTKAYMIVDSDGTVIIPNITAAATVDNNSGTPAVQVVKTGTDQAPVFTFNFTNLKGDPGQDGTDGADGTDGITPNITATASVGAGTGVPSVNVTKSGTEASPSFSFAFDGLKGPAGADGPKGDTGDTGLPGPGVATGGTTGQVLAKASSTNYDTEWVSQGTAAQKNYTDLVRPNLHDLVESNAVYQAINAAVSSIYTPRGDLTCAELTASLLVAANVGNAYTMSDSGTTTNLFLQGAGHAIAQNDNVGIIQAGPDTYLFNLMGNAFDLHNYQKEALTQTIQGASTVEGALENLASQKAEQSALDTTNGNVTSIISALATLGNGNIKYIPFYPYSQVDPTHVTETYFKNLIDKMLDDNIFDNAHQIYIGMENPNEKELVIGYIYTNQVKTSSSFVAIGLAGIYFFGYSQGNWKFKTLTMV